MAYAHMYDIYVCQFPVGFWQHGATHDHSYHFILSAMCMHTSRQSVCWYVTQNVCIPMTLMLNNCHINIDEHNHWRFCICVFTLKARYNLSVILNTSNSKRLWHTFANNCTAHVCLHRNFSSTYVLSDEYKHHNLVVLLTFSVIQHTFLSDVLSAHCWRAIPGPIQHDIYRVHGLK